MKTIACEACFGQGGFEMNGGRSMSNDYIECDVCDGIGEVSALDALLGAFAEAVHENPKVLIDEN